MTSLRVPTPARSRVPGRRVATLLGAAALLLALGCRTPEPDKVMASVNAFHFYNARYEERCVPEGPKGCSATNVALKKWRAGLDEAGAALSRGGAIPLQVKHLSSLEKEVQSCLPK